MPPSQDNIVIQSGNLDMNSRNDGIDNAKTTFVKIDTLRDQYQ
jgi:hypothetical protein